MPVFVVELANPKSIGKASGTQFLINDNIFVIYGFGRMRFACAQSFR